MKTELSDGEWTLMQRLWEAPYSTITELTAAMRQSTGWSKHTILSMFARNDDIIGMRGKNPGNLFKPAHHARSPDRGAPFVGVIKSVVYRSDNQKEGVANLLFHAMKSKRNSGKITRDFRPVLANSASTW